jgi:CubicO group peptidase (beta-lactamase class C family)
MSTLTSRSHRLLYVNLSLCVLLTLLLTACGTATTIAPAKPRQTMVSQVDYFLTTEVQNGNFSGSVLIARGGKVLFSKGYGMADWQQHLPNTPHTRFHVASLTKQFTAMAILILQVQGKLQVQDHVCTYVMDCPPAWQPITIHQLLTHTSGIPTLSNPPTTLPSSLQQSIARSIAASSWPGDKTTLPSSPQQLIARYKNQSLDFPAGTQFNYSNTGYQLLGYIIQQVSGEPYAEFVQHSIFAPLQMSDTDFEPAYPSLPNQATGYVLGKIPAAPTLLDRSLPSGWSFLLAAGGLDSTVEDLYRWDQALYTHTLFSAHSLEQMFTPYISLCPSKWCPTPLTSSAYGYGWFIAKEPDHRVMWHTGDGNGFGAYIGRYPDDKTTMIVLSNLISVDAFGLASDLEMVVFAKP